VTPSKPSVCNAMTERELNLENKPDAPDLSVNGTPVDIGGQIFAHRSVMLYPCMDALAIKPDGIYVDGTAGGGGHSYEIARRLTTGQLIAIDQDEAAIKAASAKLSPLGERARVVRSNFRHVADVLDMLGIDRIDGILLDLGVSSYQLDNAERGFSYMKDAPLDMRMDQSGGITAAELIENSSEAELRDIIGRYGEERYAGRIASAIKRACPKTTGALTECIVSALPGKARREQQHPAKRTFQALRIATNDELMQAERGVAAGVDMLLPGGRICVLTFHSLEDRIVKQYFQREEKGCTCPPELPVCVCGKKPRVKLPFKSMTPSPEELEMNPRSRSARLRAAEKL